MKIGMFVGLVLAGAALLYICTRPALSPEARMLRQRSPGATSQPSPLLSNSSQPTRTQQYPQPPTSSQQVDRPAENQPTQLNQIEPEEPPFVEKTYEVRRFYIVRRGDSLSKISGIYYGTPNKWHKIFDANRDLLDNPDMLKPGMKLYIPK